MVPTIYFELELVVGLIELHNKLTDKSNVYKTIGYYYQN